METDVTSLTTGVTHKPTLEQPILRSFLQSLIRHRWGIAAALVTLSVYLPTLRYGFVFDDNMLIDGNVNLNWGRLVRLLSSPFWAIAEEGVPDIYRHLGFFYRPLITFSYLVDKSIYGGSPWGFHLTNCLMHTINTFLVYRVTKLFFPTAWQAALLALLYGLHPNHSEVVAAIHGRTDLFASVFTMGSLLAYQWQPNERMRFVGLGLFILLFTLALGSKEQSLLIIPLVVGLHFLPEGRDWGLSFKNRCTYHGCAVVIVAGFFLLRSHALTGLGGMSVMIDAETIVKSVAQVFKLMSATLFPWGSYSLTEELSFSAHIITLEVFACLVMITLGFRRRPWLVALGMAWFVSTVLIALLGSVNVYAGELGRLSKRYAHVAMPSILWIIGAWAWQRWDSRRTAITISVCCGLLGAVFAQQTLRRNEVYNDDFTFWSIRVQEIPDHETGYYNLGREFILRGEYQNAVEALQRAIEINPYYMYGYSQANLVASLLNLGDVGPAREVLLEGLRLFPNNEALLRQLAHIEGMLTGSSSETTAWYWEARRAQADGRFSDSISPLDLIHSQLQHYRDSRFLAGFAHQQTNNPRRALMEYTLSLQVMPEHFATHTNMGYLLLELDQPGAACNSFERALAIEPDDYNAAWGLGEWRRLSSP